MLGRLLKLWLTGKCESHFAEQGSTGESLDQEMQS